MLDSIRIEITPHIIAAEVRMERGAHAGTILVVEGDTDSRLLKKFIDQRNCLVVVGNGKDNVVGSLILLEEDSFKGALGIVDADFWRLEGHVHGLNNLFLTDTHDFETMIIASEAFERFLEEWSSSSKRLKFEQDNGHKIRDYLLQEARSLGYLRYVSKMKKWNFSFRDINYDFVSPINMKVELERILRRICSSVSHVSLTNEKILAEIEDISDPNHELWDVCSGHDLTGILSRGLRRAIGSVNHQQSQPKDIEKNLRLAYDSRDFERSEMWKSIRGWEASNSGYKVFRA